METKRTIEVTCPECRGPVTEYRMGQLVEYRCMVGHAYSPRSILECHGETQERALWAAVVALEEAANLVRCVASEFEPAVARSLEQQAGTKLLQAREIRRVLEDLRPFRVDGTAEDENA